MLLLYLVANIWQLYYFFLTSCRGILNTTKCGEERYRHFLTEVSIFNRIRLLSEQTHRNCQKSFQIFVYVKSALASDELEWAKDPDGASGGEE